MSRMRITAKLRRNHCFKGCVKLLDALGLKWEAHPPTGKGHPFIEIQNPNGDPIRHHVACTPKSFKSSAYTVTALRRKLEAAGLINY